MCGILGYVGNRNATDILIGGLRRLEYRGYDSAGVAVFTGSQLDVRRAVGKLSELENLLQKKPLTGGLGLGHTRWATHGAPTEQNAHPHTDVPARIVVVHNGIIENYLALRSALQRDGVVFRSQTDTEVVSHLVRHHYDAIRKDKPATPEMFVEAVLRSLRDIQGTFALGLVCADFPDLLIGARRDCPLIVGLGEGENFLASDVPAILSHTRRVIFLEEGDVAVIRRSDVRILGIDGKPVERSVHQVAWDPIQAEKGGYKHFMLKEIHEQPRVVENTLLGRLNSESQDVSLADSGLPDEEARGIKNIRFIACGTSWHASLVAGYWIEQRVGLPCRVEIASEFRYRQPVVEPDTLVVAVSQSGETADTLAAARLAKKSGAKVLAVTNVMGSTLTREAHGSFLTHCGPEIGVASTKAFMGQLVSLYLLTLNLARVKKTVSVDEQKELGRLLISLPGLITKTLRCESHVTEVARKFFRSRDFLFLGRNVNYPVAMEGALKLKEISYIHAEGYPAGEMKHGPIALIDENLPVVAIATRSHVYDKMLSNIEEARSRGAMVIAIATEGDTLVREKAAEVIYVPDVPEEISPMLTVIPLQILAYEIAVLLGCDVDQPRNLAKSVTVE